MKSSEIEKQANMLRLRWRSARFILIGVLFLMISVVIILTYIALTVDEPLKSRQQLSGEVNRDLDRVQLQIEAMDGGRYTVEAEVAHTVQQRRIGLMNRESLGELNGMIFLNSADAISPFWMGHTYIPLDIIFIDASGSIVDISENAQPCPEADGNCTLYFPSTYYRHVLEVNGGWTRKNGIGVGDKVRLDTVESYLN